MPSASEADRRGQERKGEKAEGQVQNADGGLKDASEHNTPFRSGPENLWAR
jgi:hypothetical protein